MSDTLFVRLGSEAGIRAIAADVVDNHVTHPLIAPRFAGSDLPRLKKMAGDFFIAGTGGPAIYEGKDMLTAHRHMNISDIEFMAVVDDVMAALDKNGIGQREKEELLFTFYSLRPQVVRV